MHIYAYVCMGRLCRMSTRRENACMVFVTILGREPDAHFLGSNSRSLFILYRGAIRELSITRRKIYFIQRNPFSLSLESFCRFTTIANLEKKKIFIAQCDILVYESVCDQL